MIYYSEFLRLINNEEVCDLIMRILADNGLIISYKDLQKIWQNNWINIIKKIIENTYGFKQSIVGGDKSQFVLLSLLTGSVDALIYLIDKGYCEFIENKPINVLLQNAFYEGVSEKTNVQIETIVFLLKNHLNIDNENLIVNLVKIPQLYMRNISSLNNIIFSLEKTELRKIVSMEHLIWAHMMSIFNYQYELANMIEISIDWSIASSEFKFQFEKIQLKNGFLDIHRVFKFLEIYKDKLKSNDYFKLCIWLVKEKHSVIAEELLINRPDILECHFTINNISKELDVNLFEFWDILDWVILKKPELNIHQNNYEYFKLIRGKVEAQLQISQIYDIHMEGFIRRYPEIYRRIEVNSNAKIIYLAADENWEPFNVCLENFLDKHRIKNINRNDCLICNEISESDIIKTCVTSDYLKGHIYCIDCLSNWLREDRTNCPYCRKILL